ncbi:MAG: helix-turn-helix domain-containing protein [Vicingaceae bacterium]|jgi:AcrR family transcriptional regulator
MKSLISNIQIQVQHSLYLKDPLSSELGKKIIKGSIELICELGFEQFTFKKLAVKIASTEASVYRYFESKNKVLLYLTNWYWSWLEYRLVFATTNVPSAYDQLTKAVYLLTEDITEDGNFEHIDEGKLHQIVLSESLKSFLTKDVDSDNEGGAFAPYKNLVQRISNIILQINPNYKYPHMLVSTVVEGAHIQRHFANHLPRLTDVVEGEDAVAEFYSQIVFKAIK